MLVFPALLFYFSLLIF